jgi:hypothetical protein
MSDRAQIVAGPNYIVLAFRIGTVKNSKNFLRVDGPARVMMAPLSKPNSWNTNAYD